MRLTTLLPILLTPLLALSAPLTARAPAKPKPCTAITPAPSTADTQARFNKFANAFIVTKNITEAFEYISQGYINHNPAAKNGFDSAWNILSPMWGGESITPIRTAFDGSFGWLNYRVSGMGEVVDRYRWDAGCIAEHWDQGEKFPTNVTSTPL